MISIGLAIKKYSEHIIFMVAVGLFALANFLPHQAAADDQSLSESLWLSPLTKGKRATAYFSPGVSGQFKRVVFYKELGNNRRQMIGAANAPADLIGSCSSAGAKVFQFSFVLPKTGDALTLSAIGITVQGQQVAVPLVRFALAPEVAIFSPAHGICVERGKPVALRVRAPVSGISAFIMRTPEYTQSGIGADLEFGDGGSEAGNAQPAQPAQHAGKGLPKRNQHEVGDDLTGDVGYDDDRGSKGDNSCFPTAVGASLEWFDANGFPEMIADDASVKDVVNNLGGKAKTGQPDPNKNGTKPEDMRAAVDAYLKERGLSDKFEGAEVFYNPSIEQIAEEFDRGQDVTIGYFHNRYERKDNGGKKKLLGHIVAVNGVGAARDDGSRLVQIMNPRTGEYEDIVIFSDGHIEGGDPEATLARGVLLAVSPKEKRGGGLPLRSKAYRSGVVTASLDLSAKPVGRYVLSAVVTDKKSRQAFADHQEILLKDACPETSR